MSREWDEKENVWDWLSRDLARTPTAGDMMRGALTATREDLHRLIELDLTQPYNADQRAAIADHLKLLGIAVAEWIERHGEEPYEPLYE